MGVKKMKKRYFLVGMIVIAIMLVATTTSINDRYFHIAKNMDIFAKLYKEVNTYYVDEVNPNTLMKSGIDAMLNSLDPYTNYIPENEIEDYRKANIGQYGGIGALTSNINGTTRIVMVYKGFVAYKKGIKIGDEIIAVDGISIKGKNRKETNLLMKGQAGTEITLTLRRHNKTEPFDIVLEREKITINHVPYHGIIKSEVGYVKLTEFTPSVSKEVRLAVQELIENGAQKIILDLRSNPGGLLIEAVNICNIFLQKGKEIVSTKGKIKENNITYSTLNNPLDIKIPVAVLINSSSASASEIVAGTFQDYDRAIIVGEKSFGKGLVQVPRPLSYNAQVKITTAKYYTPSGRCIQALDYTHRNPDGSVGQLPDSLKTPFKTTNGRIVYDGGGVDPDLEVVSTPFSILANTLYQNCITLDYSTRYYQNHDSIPSPREFELDNNNYRDFLLWLKDKQPKLPYQSSLENQLDGMLSMKMDSSIEAQVKDLQTLVTKEKMDGFLIYKNQIKQYLESDIVSHYYLEKGKIEAKFKHDKQLQATISLLNDNDKYQKILQSTK